jgi:hypothetical protein
VGDTLTLTIDVDPAEADLTYIWYRGTSVIPGTTGQRIYQLQPGDAHKDITVKVTASLPQGETVTKYSNHVLVDQQLTVQELTLDGVGQIGQRLTVTATVLPADATVSYAWYRGVSLISTAGNSPTYTIQTADAGQTIKVKTTFVKGDWSVTQYTNGVVVQDIVRVTENPTLLGATEVGAVLTAQIAFTPDTAQASYDWFRVKGGVATHIVANGPTYTVQAADVTYTIKVKVTVSAAGLVDAVKYAETSSAVTGQPAPAVTSAVLSQSGGVVTATVGLILPDGATVRYDWYRGTTYLNGVTGTAYAVQAQDIGADLKLKVTITTPGSPTVTRYSPALRVVDPGH